MRSRAPAGKTKNPSDDSAQIARGLGSSCRVHKPRVPQGPASTPGLGPNRQHTTHGLAQESKTTGRKGGPVTDRKVWTKRNSTRSSTTSAHLSNRTARFRLQPPPDGLSNRKAGPKCYFRLRPRVSDRGSQKPCSPLFSNWRDQDRLGPSDQECPLGRNHATNGKSKPGRIESNHDTRDHTLHACRNSTLQLP